MDVGRAEEPVLSNEEEEEQGAKVTIVVPDGVLPGDDVLITAPCGRELYVRSETVPSTGTWRPLPNHLYGAPSHLCERLSAG